MKQLKTNLFSNPKIKKFILKSLKNKLTNNTPTITQGNQDNDCPKESKEQPE
jgi:hypothetical protein